MFRQSSIEKEELPAPGIVAQLITHMNNNTNYGAALPARTARLLGRSRASTPEAIVKPRTAQSTPPGQPPDDNTSLRLERSTHGSMQQDIVSIKAMLLKLKRVLQEPDEGLNLMRTETLNPLDIQSSPLKYGPSLHLGEEGEASPPPPPPEPHEEVADLKRQLVFLQSQLEERERMVKLLQQQMNKYSENSLPNDHKCNGSSGEDMCNVATQTERLRPLSQGPNILQGLNSETHSGGLVSWNEKKSSSPKLTTSPNDFSTSPTSSPTSKHKKTISDNGKISNCSNNRQDVRNGTNTNGVQLKINCRVGSRYLQAINDKNNLSLDSGKGDFCERTARSRSLHSSRSASVENVHKSNNGLKIFNNNNNDYIDCDNSQAFSDSTLVQNIKHKKIHTSCNNLQSMTDGSESDYSLRTESPVNVKEDHYSGHKSLPLNINGNSKCATVLNGSGIPRKSNNFNYKFSTTKQAQRNKC